MNGADALWAELSRGMPTTITGMVAALGGSTRAAAEALGVVQRTVQRRLAGEAAAAGRPVKATEQRGQSARGQAIGSKALRTAHARSQQGKQVHARAAGTLKISGGYSYARDARTDDYGEFDTTAADNMWAAFVEGDKAEAWNEFEVGLLDAYGLDQESHGGVHFENQEVDSLDAWFT